MNNKEKFIDHVKSECKKYGIKCSLRPVKYLKLSGNIKCSGYFDEENRVLACATNKKDWLSILVHEYGHMTQWIDNCKTWKKMEDTSATYKVDKWLGGGKVKHVNYHIDIVKNLELDNEKRSVKLIKDYGLEKYIDIKDYIKKANAYVQFYNYIKITRKWSSPKNSPYSNEELVAEMPDRFSMKYKSMSKRVYKAFLKANI